MDSNRTIRVWSPHPGVGHRRRVALVLRARHESWSLGAERNATELPVGDFEDGPDTFFVSEDFGVEAFDASYMTLDAARYFIVRELSRLRARPDSGI